MRRRQFIKLLGGAGAMALHKTGMACSQDGNLPSTTAFLKAVQRARNLAAVLVGHTHSARADAISETAVQYVAGRAVDGRHRLVTFKPLA